MKAKIEALKDEALKALTEIKNLEELEHFRVQFLGKKGEMTQILKEMGSLSAEVRPLMGKVANEVREIIESSIDSMKERLKSAHLDAKLSAEQIDVTLPGIGNTVGHGHPLTVVLDEVKAIFMGMGFKIAEGPEVETVYHNFDALNSPIDHPSRSESDTFYITDDLLLRCHTSSVQIRTMKNSKPPIKVISPGRCYRFDELDATHSPMFHQIEGLVVDEHIAMSDLIGTLNVFVQRLFGSQTRTKFRPHHFPFTEPSAEVDVSCFKCGGDGCRFCGYSGWIEILGAGMVHPTVLEECGIDPEKYSGFAFGMGLDRITMLKYEIDDIRLLFENDMRFIKQF